jgi:translation initiation factor 2 alpha subunit (eIF-2alpha)
MAMRKPQWLETGDLEFATVEAVTDYGAYAKLDEFDKRGYLHASKISIYINHKAGSFRREN